MKKIMLLLCICGFGLPAIVQAQDSLSVKPQATAPYRVATVHASQPEGLLV